MTVLGRPTRQTGILARDQILAWQLALQDQRYCGGAFSGCHGENELKAKRANKAAAGAKAVNRQTAAKGVSSSNQLHSTKNGRCQKRLIKKRTTSIGVGEGDVGTTSAAAKLQKDESKLRSETMETDGGDNQVRSCSISSPQLEKFGVKLGSVDDLVSEVYEVLPASEQSFRTFTKQARIAELLAERQRHRAQMALQARIERTRTVACRGHTSGSDRVKCSSVPITLCPSDDWHKCKGGRKLGPLQNSNLSTSMQATVLHLKQFLLDRLLFGGKTSDILIACRGLVLRDDHSVLSVKELIWPASHPLSPVLRYRLRGPDERPSSLTHTGEAARSSICAGDMVVESLISPHQPFSVPMEVHRCSAPQSVLGAAAAAAVVDITGSPGHAMPTWVEQFPSDFVYNRSFVRGAAGVRDPRHSATEKSVAAGGQAALLAASRSLFVTQDSEAESGATTVKRVN